MRSSDGKWQIANSVKPIFDKKMGFYIHTLKRSPSLSLPRRIAAATVHHYAIRNLPSAICYSPFVNGCP
jgi:hypothetical protein